MSATAFYVDLNSLNYKNTILERNKKLKELSKLNVLSRVGQGFILTNPNTPYDNITFFSRYLIYM